MTALPQCQELVALVRAAQADGARLKPACEELGISLRTWQHWSDGEQVPADGRPQAKRPVPANKLLWLALRNVLAKSVRAAFDWSSAMNQFAILFGERFTSSRG